MPVLTLAYVHSSYPALIVAGFFLGIGGTAFAVGVPLVSGWYPPARRGFALGVFGVGMGGTAIANFTTVRLADGYGERPRSCSSPRSWSGTPPWRPCCCATRRPADRRVSPWQRLAAVGPAHRHVAAVLPLRGRASAGSSRSASTCPPTCAPPTASATATPRCVRPGSSSSPSSPARSAAGSPTGCTRCRCWSGRFAGVAVLAVVQAFQPPLMPVGTIAFLGMAALLGAASGAVFALVGKVAPADKVGAVTGLVGAAGGLGGFVPPLVMGWVYGIEGSYAIGLMLLSDVALAAAVYTAVKMANVARA